MNGGSNFNRYMRSWFFLKMCLIYHRKALRSLGFQGLFYQVSIHFYFFVKVNQKKVIDVLDEKLFFTLVQNRVKTKNSPLLTFTFYKSMEVINFKKVITYTLTMKTSYYYFSFFVVSYFFPSERSCPFYHSVRCLQPVMVLHPPLCLG